MGKLQIVLLSILIALLALEMLEAMVETYPTCTIVGEPHSHEISSVFEPGEFSTAEIKTAYVQVYDYDPIASNSNGTRVPLLIYSPTKGATYPVVLFLPGTCLQSPDYSVILQFIASHGYIVVSPDKLYKCLDVIFDLSSGQKEVEYGTQVVNWIAKSLSQVLPTSVVANLDKLAVGGHSRGGKAAFAIALGRAKHTSLAVKISALIGLDPVAGLNKYLRFQPEILTFDPNSFDLSIPVTIIGTGLGNKFPACAPNGVSHVEFYNECKGPVTHFVTKYYGHLDMLDDHFTLAKLLCKSCSKKFPKDSMRRTVGGIIVSFLEAYFNGNNYFLDTIVDVPSVAPVTLDQPQSKQPHTYSII